VRQSDDVGTTGKEGVGELPRREPSDEGFTLLLDKAALWPWTAPPSIQFTDAADLQVTVEGKVVAVPIERISVVCLADDVVPSEATNTIYIDHQSLWVNTADRNRILISIDPPIVVPRDISWSLRDGDALRPVPIRRLYLNVAAPEAVVEMLNSRRSSKPRSRTNVATIDAPPLSGTELGRLELNAILGGPDSFYPEVLVAHRVDRGDVTYRFAAREELTEKRWYELPDAGGGATQCFLLKHSLLELLAELTRWIGRDALVAHEEGRTERSVYDDDHFVVVDCGNEERLIDPRQPEEYEIFKRKGGRLALIEDDYSTMWDLAQLVAAHYHAEWQVSGRR